MAAASYSIDAAVKRLLTETLDAALIEHRNHIDHALSGISEHLKRVEGLATDVGRAVKDVQAQISLLHDGVKQLNAHEAQAKAHTHPATIAALNLPQEMPTASVPPPDAAPFNAPTSTPPSPDTLVPSTPFHVRNREARTDADGDAVMSSTNEGATQTQTSTQLPANPTSEAHVSAAEKNMWRQEWELDGQKDTLEDFVRRRRGALQDKTARACAKAATTAIHQAYEMAPPPKRQKTNAAPKPKARTRVTKTVDPPAPKTLTSDLANTEGRDTDEDVADEVIVSLKPKAPSADTQKTAAGIPQTNNKSGTELAEPFGSAPQEVQAAKKAPAKKTAASRKTDSTSTKAVKFSTVPAKVMQNAQRKSQKAKAGLEDESTHDGSPTVEIASRKDEPASKQNPTAAGTSPSTPHADLLAQFKPRKQK